ncbi:MAG: GNAT family N-acetyltransferase [Parcubacteria group bacterium]|jgi:ribosomal protein S18 acetylase RimI-like enzyme
MKNITIKKIKSSEAPFELLLLADPSSEAVNKYLKKGSCFAAFEGGEIVGVYILISKSTDILEIINLSVAEEKQNRGIGKLLVADAKRRAKKSRAKKLLVGTGNSSINQLAFYQKCGFRISGIKKDFFAKNYKKPIFENSIQCRDMVMFELVF